MKNASVNHTIGGRSIENYEILMLPIKFECLPLTLIKEYTLIIFMKIYKLIPLIVIKMLAKNISQYKFQKKNDNIKNLTELTNLKSFFLKTNSLSC